MNVYPNKIDFLSRIDDALNSLEMPLRARFYWGYVPKEPYRPICMIKKTDTRQGSHLKIQVDDKVYKVKYTTCLESRRTPLQLINPELYGPDVFEERVYLKLPLALSHYRKTWDGCDLILGEQNHPSRKVTALYWFDAPLLLDFIERLKEPYELKRWDSFGKEQTSLFTREDLVVGIDVEEYLDKRLNLVRQRDWIDWTAKRIHAVSGMSLLPTSMDSRGLDFSFRDNKKMQKAHWPNFKLLPYADQSVPITITNLDTGKEGTYPSAVAAVKDFESRGYKLRRASLSHVLHGRQKTIKTGIGKITVRYAEVPKAS